MVHAPELLGYEQYTPFPAACQWQSERPPPVAGAFAGLFMALGAPLLAWERPAWRAVCLVLSFASLPLSLRLILLTASAYVCRSRKEDRPWRAAHQVCLGATGPILAEGHAKNRQTSPASFFSLPLPFWLGAYCHLQGPPKSVDFGRKTGRTAAHRVCLGGRRPPFWRKGTPKTGKHRPPRALAREPTAFVEANFTYSLRLHLSLSAGKTRWWGSRCGGRARRDCRWRPRTPSRARRSRRRG